MKQGEIVLPPIREPPDLLRRLLTRDHPISDSFFKNIRQYTSIAYTPDRRLGASEYNPTFQIQGELYHLQGPLNPQASGEPVYAQYFIYDPDVTEWALPEPSSHWLADSTLESRLL
jgi:hypothetical protein